MSHVLVIVITSASLDSLPVAPFKTSGFALLGFCYRTHVVLSIGVIHDPIYRKGSIYFC